MPSRKKSSPVAKFKLPSPTVKVKRSAVSNLKTRRRSGCSKC